MDKKITSFTNYEIAKLLRQVAAAYTIRNENRFKITAYEKASETIEKSTVDVKDLWEEGKLSELPGIGKALFSYLDELFNKGKVRHFEEVMRSLPAGMFVLLEVTGFGPKKAYKLAQIFKLNDRAKAIDRLLEVAKQGKIASLEGFGDTSQADIIEALKRFKMSQMKKKRMPLPYASQIAVEVIEYLKKNPYTKNTVPLGSLRRQLSTIGDIDIAVSTYQPQKVIDWFLKYPKKLKIVEKGPSGATLLLANLQQIDLRVINPAQFGSMLQYFTGSKQHNIKLRELALKKGYSLSEYGIKKVKSQKSKVKSQNFNNKLKLFEFNKEENFYQFLGLDWIPPELREDQGEIEVSLQHKLPKLIEVSDIKGDLHIHSNYDLKSSHDLGASSIEELIKEAQNLNYEYLGISDHNPAHTNLSQIQIVSIMKRRKIYIEHIKLKNKSTRVNLFIMLETDILPNGKLALPDEAFEFVDASIVSIHSNFKMPKEKMTDRIIKGLSHPKAKILAHPTGRLLEKREGYEVEWNKIFDFCKKHDKALEINAYPDRLDLPDLISKRAIESGIKLVINTDAHDKSHLPLMTYGVSVARRSWAKESDILNTLSYEKIREWLVG